MPIYEYECDKCGARSEHIHSIHEVLNLNCHLCEGGKIVKIIAASGQYLGNQDAPWTRSVLEVVDKENPARHVQEFVKNPNRSTYKAWMKGEGLRPMDSNVNGAPPVYKKPPPPDTSRLRREVAERHMQRRRIEI